LNKLLVAIASASIAFLAGCATTPEPAPEPPRPAPVAAPAPAPRQATPAPAPAPAPAPVAAVAAPKRCDVTVTFQNDEVFPFMRPHLTAAAKARLDSDVISKIAACSRIEAVVIEGHSDRMGGQRYNQKLSEQRAEGVKAYLVSKGVDRNRIETLGMGKTVPAKFCPDSKGRAEQIACLAPNRRAIVSIKGIAR